MSYGSRIDRVAVAAPSQGMPDLSREGPFDVHQDGSMLGASPRVLDSLPGCQYRMTSIPHVHTA